jgi:hypothetical protein
MVLTVHGAHLFLNENAGVARSNEPVTFGIPVKQGELPNATIGSNAAMSLAGYPAQVQVLSTWPDKSARWVVASFLADFQASENKTISFGHGSGFTGSSSLTVTDQTGSVEINTGKIRIEILKGQQFNLINRVWRGSTLLVDNTGKRGLVLQSYINNGDSDEYVGRALTDSIIVEENGPIRAVVYIAGRFYSGTKVLKAAGENPCNIDIQTRFMVRIYAYSNSEEIKIATVLHNTGGNGQCSPDAYIKEGQHPEWTDGTTKDFSMCDHYSQPLYFTQLYYDLNMTASGTKTVTSENGYSAALNSSDNFAFLQATPTQYYLFKNNSQSGTGAKGLGYVDVAFDNNGIGAVYKHCWELYPKRIDVIGNNLRINIFPKDISPGTMYFMTRKVYGTKYSDLWQQCYVLPGGMWARSDVHLSFHGTGFDIAGFAKSKNNPVMPKFDDNYLHGIKVLEGFYSDTLNILEPLGSLPQRLVERRNIMTGVMYDPALTEERPGGKPRETIFEHMNDAPDSYGYLNFADIKWAEGYCNLHYDVTAGVLHSWLRTGNYKAWQATEAFAYHRINNVTYHHENGVIYYDGISVYEKHDHVDGIKLGKQTHHWVEGLGLYYCLTGDRFAGAAFRESVENAFWVWAWVYNFGDDFNSGVDNGNKIRTALRYQGWNLNNLCHGYDILGEERYYDILPLVFHRCLIPTEDSVGPGFETNFTQIHGYAAKGFIKLFHTIKPEHASFKDSVAQLLGRMWEVTQAHYTPGRVEGNLYYQSMYQAFTEGVEKKYSIGDYIQLGDLGGFAWKHLNKPGAREYAFHDACKQVCYINGFSGDKDSILLDDYAQASVRLGRFPGTESKYHGKIGYFGRMLLEYEYDTMVPLNPGDGSLKLESGPVKNNGPELHCMGNLPNPFNPVTVLQFNVPQKLLGRTFSVSIYDIQGRIIRSMIIPVTRSGRIKVIWNGKDNVKKETGSGVYFARYGINGKATGKIKMVKIK